MRMSQLHTFCWVLISCFPAQWAGRACRFRSTDLLSASSETATLHTQRGDKHWKELLFFFYRRRHMPLRDTDWRITKIGLREKVPCGGGRAEWRRITCERGIYDEWHRSENASEIRLNNSMLSVEQRTRPHAATAATHDADSELCGQTILFICFSFKAPFASAHHGGQAGANRDR